MAWRSVGESNADLIQKLRMNGVITDEAVEQCMIQTDRKHYSPRNPYTDGESFQLLSLGLVKNP